MGHWSDSLLDEFAQQIGGNPDRRDLAEALAKAGHRIDALTGRIFHPVRQMTSIIESNGLPFADVPNMNVGSMDPGASAWQIADPVNLQMASVLQVSSLAEPDLNATSIADALWIAGQLLADASRAGRLTGDYILHWLVGSTDHDQRMELLRRVMDPMVRFSVPILGLAVKGWWIQVARRLIWVTSQAEDEGRLLEPLLLETATIDGKAIPLAAAEPILIVARMTKQPADWAFSARIWPAEVGLPVDYPWHRIAKAIHSNGMPTITLDSASTPYEIACQVLLKGYWHGYVGNDEPALATAIAAAYPRQVEQIRRGTRSPNKASAAAILLEQLVRPGFNPAQGAEATRRYVRSKASIAVKQHRKEETPDRYPWTQLGISERRYYKLLPQFAQKTNGRYVVEQDEVLSRMKAHLNDTDKERTTRGYALEVLRSHGFSEAAARKWLQRHEFKDAVDAWPRGQRPTAPSSD
jgi:hypothetical protein